MNLIEKLRDTQAPSHRDTLHKLAADTVELLTAQLKASNTAHAATMKELIERLRQKAGQYDEYDWHSVTELEAADALERMVAENAALRADAERYRWLRRVERGLRGWNVMHYAKCYTEKTLDEVIDAAIGEKHDLPVA